MHLCPRGGLPVKAWINPVEGIITSSFGTRTNPFGEDMQTHKGIDIGIAENTPVACIADGTVIESGNSKSYGIYVKFITYDGYQVTYAHLNQSMVKKGQEITQGETVALSGNTGDSTGPHLHLGIEKEGVFLDPMDFVSLLHTKEVESEYNARGETI